MLFELVVFHNSMMKVLRPNLQPVLLLGPDGDLR